MSKVEDEAAIDEPDLESLTRLQAALSAFVSEDLTLPGSIRDGPQKPYGRRLLHHDIHVGHALIAMLWPPGAVTPVHDHGTWGLVGVLEGELEVTDFTRIDDPGLEGGFVLSPSSPVLAQKGDVATVHPRYGDIHRIRNPTDAYSVSIHLYGAIRVTHKVYDLQAGGVKRVRMPRLTEPLTADQLPEKRGVLRST